MSGDPDEPDLQTRASAFFSANPTAKTEAEASSLLNVLKQKLKTFSIASVTYYVAEGDTLLDEDQLSLYALQREKDKEARRAAELASAGGLGLSSLAPDSRALLGMVQNGKIVRWPPGTILSYRVVRGSFSAGQGFTPEQKYDMVVDRMTKATADWESTCGVQFQHRSDLDGEQGTGPEGALFPVREIDANGAFIAAAFFPNDPKARRRVLIDLSYFTDTGFDPVGVLRHELGHVLGFRHEHIRSGAPPDCPGEETEEAIDLTKYDPRSVMHYFCGGQGSRQLKITDLDREGTQKVYGPALSGFAFVGV